jgi:hypothetical protein
VSGDLSQVALRVLVHRLLRATEFNKVHLRYLNELLLVLPHKVEGDHKMALFPEFFVFVDIFSQSISISNGNIEVFSTEDKTLVDIDKSRDNLVGLLVDEMLNLGVTRLIFVQ